MAGITLIYQGQLKTLATHLHSGVEILTDAPLDNGGMASSFSPTDLVASALGSCIMTIMGKSAATHGFDIDGTRVEITKIMTEAPRKIAEIQLIFHFPKATYSNKEIQLLEYAVHHCPVALSLHKDIRIHSEFLFDGNAGL